MKKIYSVLVENRSGVLCKVAGLFSRRCFNIDSLAVGETDDAAVSCVTIVSSGNERTIEQIEKQLNKKLDVIKVKTFDETQSISRELMLVKVKYNKSTRHFYNTDGGKHGNKQLCPLRNVTHLYHHLVFGHIHNIRLHQYCRSGADRDAGTAEMCGKR